MGKTGLCTDARFVAHVVPDGAPSSHPECPERVVAIQRALDAHGLTPKMTPLPSRAATRAELEGAHSPHFLDALEAEVKGKRGWIDSDTYYCEATWDAALHAAGAAVELALHVADGRLANGLALVRPPGHHATWDRAMGFCLLNNVAIAAARLKAEGARVAIVDWDVHHGNGTEDITERLGGILYCSTHEWPQYPGTGPAALTGREGLLVNVPLPAGTDDSAYLAAYKARVAPALEQFRPDVILVSAGFDAHHLDPIGGLDLTEASYGAVTRHLLGVTPKVAVVLEGGYSLEALARSTVRVAELLLQAGGA